MDMSKEINLTVLMPAYNASKYIEEAIQSILNQTYSKFNLLVINDGSSDCTEQIINDFCEKDGRVVYVKNEKNLGLIGVLKKGIDLVKTKYVARMDADDIAMPNRLALQMAFMEANQNVIASGGAIKYIGQNEGAIFHPKKEHEEIVAEFFFRNPMVHPAMILRNDLLKKYNLNYASPTFVDASEYVWPEDYALWYDLSKKGKLANIEDVILEYRIGAQSISIKEKSKQFDRYSNFFRYLFSDIGILFTPNELKIHTEFALRKQISFSPNEYKNWLNKLTKFSSLSVYPIDLIKKLINEQWSYFSYCFADKGLFHGIQCLGNVNNKVTYLKYLVKKSLRFNFGR